MGMFEIILGSMGILLAVVSLAIRFGSNHAPTLAIMSAILVSVDIIQMAMFGDTGIFACLGLACWVILLIWDTIRWSNS